MGKQQVGCTHCGKPVTVDILDERDVRDILKPVLDSTAGLAEQLSKSRALPDEVVVTLGRVAAAGESMEQAAQELNTAKEKAGGDGHIRPTTELLENWEGCKDCKPGWDVIKGKVAAEARVGYIPLDEAKEIAIQIARQTAGVKVGGDGD